MKFPKFKLTGGPHAKNLRLTVDGEETDRVTRVELVADVNDVVRVKVYYLAEVEIQLEEAYGEKMWHTRLMQVAAKQIAEGPSAGEWVRTAEQLAKTDNTSLSEALRTLAQIVEERDGAPA